MQQPSSSLSSSTSNYNKNNNHEKSPSRSSASTKNDKKYEQDRVSRSRGREKHHPKSYDERTYKKSRRRFSSRSKSPTYYRSRSKTVKSRRSRSRSRSRSPSYSRSRSYSRSSTESSSRDRSYSRRRKKRSHSNSKSNSKSNGKGKSHSKSKSPSPSRKESPPIIKKEKVSKFSDLKVPPPSSSTSTLPTSSSSTPNDPTATAFSNPGNMLPTPMQMLNQNALTALQQQQQLALRLVLAGNTNTTNSLLSSQNPLMTSSLFPFPSSTPLFPNSSLSQSQLGGIPSLGNPLSLNPLNPLFASSSITSLASSLYVEPKEYKELFVGNTPSGVTEMVVMEFLNAAMRHTGLYSGPEGVEPIITCRLNSKFAFVETRTSQDATNAMHLDNIPFLGNMLKIGRPSKYYGPTTPHKTFQELISGPGFIKVNTSPDHSRKVTEFESNSNHELDLSSSTSSNPSSAPSSVPNPPSIPHSPPNHQNPPPPPAPPTSAPPANTTIPISNIIPSPLLSTSTIPTIPVLESSPKIYRELFVGNTSTEMNAENLKEFLGNALEKMGFLSSPGNPILNIRVNSRFSFVEMRSVEEAANCLNLNGIPFLGQSLKISRPTKYSGVVLTHYNWDDILSRWLTGDLKTMTSGPSSRVLMLSNMVLLDDLNDDQSYHEMIQETRDEISQYGHIKSIIIPRPGINNLIQNSLHKGIGKVFIEMSTEEEATRVLIALKGRSFDGRIVDVKYFPIEKFTLQDLSDPPPIILTVNGFVDIDTILGNKLQPNTITMNTPTAAQLSSYAHLLPSHSQGSSSLFSSSSSSSILNTEALNPMSLHRMKYSESI